MKTKLFLLFPLFLFITTPVLAVDPTPTATATPTVTVTPTTTVTPTKSKEAYRQEMKDRKQAQIKEFQEKKQEAKKEFQIQKRSWLTQAKLNILEKIYTKIKSGFDKRYQFLETTKAKIQAKISEKETSGTNVNEAKTYLDKIPALQKEYTVTLATFEKAYADLKTADKPMQSLPALRKAAQDIRRILNDIKKAETSAIKSVIATED